jgi:hypothetical protein
MKTTGNILIGVSIFFFLGALFQAFSLIGLLTSEQMEFSVFLPRLVGTFLFPVLLLIGGLKLREKGNKKE